MDKITELFPQDASNDPDNVLKSAIGEYEHVVVIGVSKDGTGISVAADAKQSDLEVVGLIEQGKYLICSLIDEEF